MLISKVRTHTPVFCQWCFIVAATAALSHLLYSLDLVSHHHGVLFADLGGSLGLVIIGTVVLVRVPVDAAEQVATATVETWRPKNQGLKAGMGAFHKCTDRNSC